VTEGSFDAYMWQALETKARFIAQVTTGESAVRRAEDIGGQELSYAEVKAIASGNPAVLTMAEADAELQRLAILRKNHADEQYLARKNLKELPGTIDRLEHRVSGLTQDIETLARHATDPITIAGHACAADEAVKALSRQLDRLPADVNAARSIPLGTYRGLTFGLVLHRYAAPDAYLEGEVTRHAPLARDPGPRAVLNALDRLAGSYPGQLASARQELAIAEAQLRDYESRLGQPFAHDAYLSELAALRDQLRTGLSGGTPEPGTLPPPPAAETAERIKTLKASHAALPSAERTAGRASVAAEMPVTARIRRRAANAPRETEIEPDADPAARIPEPPAAIAVLEPVPTPEPDDEEPAAIEPPFPGAPRHAPAFRQRVAHARRQQARQLTLF
jgi:hypothetical protein